MIFHDLKCIFVHIPKTAGTSIEYALRKVKKKFAHIPDHRILSDYLASNTKDFWKYHKFTVIRDPVEREISLYNFLVASRRGNKRRAYHDHTFTDYLYNIKENKNFYHNNLHRMGQESTLKVRHLYSDQVEYLTMDNQICVDQIIRFEDLHNGFEILCDKLNVEKTKLAHIRKSKLKMTLNEEQLNLIKEVRKKDYELLSY